MTDKEQQLEQFRKAVERKAEAAHAASPGAPPPHDESGGANPATQQDLIHDKTPQDVMSVRAKSEGKGKRTADKWNQ